MNITDQMENIKRTRSLDERVLEAQVRVFEWLIETPAATLWYGAIKPTLHNIRRLIQPSWKSEEERFEEEYKAWEGSFSQVDKNGLQETAMEEASSKPEKQLVGDAVFVNNGTHIGPVIKIENGYVIQKSGRTELTAHDMINIMRINNELPKIGDLITIQYKSDGCIKNYDCHSKAMNNDRTR